MKLTFARQSALYVLRTIRREAPNRLLGRRCELVDPDPSPGARWSRKRLEAFGAGGGLPGGKAARYHVAVSDKDARLQMQGVSNVIHGTGLPSGAFVELGGGIAISGPELLFVEMACEMTEAGHLMLGHELCGSFVRHPDDPLGGGVLMGAEAVTSVSRIGEFLSRLKNVRGLERARHTLELLADNAWSPTESIVAAVAALPVAELGYELGPVVLNRRYETPDVLSESTSRSSRVPDIMFGETGVGINYDGVVHLDLEAIAGAGRDAALNPGDPQFEQALRRVMREVRAKAVDDIRRNRELAADGLVVFPVVKEDLYEPGGLDRVMLQVVATIERRIGRSLGLQRKALASASLRERRQQLLFSLLPGSRCAAPDGVLLEPGTGVEASSYAIVGF